MTQEDDRQAQIQRLRDKSFAYIKLFGPPADPTPYGKIVLDDLERFCTLWTESIKLTKDDAIDPYGTIYRDGKKAVALRIHAWLRWSEDHGSSSRSPEPVEHPDPANPTSRS